MADALTAPFVMHGARDAIAGGLAHIEQRVKRTELAVVENRGFAFDLAKTLVESVCRAVLGERSIRFGFLHRVHRQDRTPLPSSRGLYDDSPEFNESVDDAHGMIRIYEVEFRPSEVLFQMEPETYRVYRAELETTGTASEDAGTG